VAFYNRNYIFKRKGIKLTKKMKGKLGRYSIAIQIISRLAQYVKVYFFNDFSTNFSDLKTFLIFYVNNT